MDPTSERLISPETSRNKLSRRDFLASAAAIFCAWAMGRFIEKTRLDDFAKSLLAQYEDLNQPMAPVSQVSSDASFELLNKHHAGLDLETRPWAKLARMMVAPFGLDTNSRSTQFTSQATGAQIRADYFNHGNLSFGVYDIEGSVQSLGTRPKDPEGFSVIEVEFADARHTVKTDLLRLEDFEPLERPNNPIAHISIDGLQGPFFFDVVEMRVKKTAPLTARILTKATVERAPLQEIRIIVTNAITNAQSTDEDHTAITTGNVVPEDVRRRYLNSISTYLTAVNAAIPIMTVNGGHLPKILATDLLTRVTASVKVRSETAGEQFSEMVEKTYRGVGIAEKSLLGLGGYAGTRWFAQNILEYLRKLHPVKVPIVTRRDFLSMVVRVPAAVATGASLVDLGSAVGDKLQIDQSVFDSMTHVSLPSEESPAGYRGVIEQLLDTKESDLPPLVIDTIFRDLTSVYKEKVLQREVPSGGTSLVAWGQHHVNQIGLFDLSPDHIFLYLQKFKKQFPRYLEENFNNALPPDQIWTATEYDLSRTGETFQVRDYHVRIFPRLWELFKNLAAN